MLTVFAHVRAHTHTDSSFRDVSSLNTAGMAYSVPVGIPMFPRQSSTATEPESPVSWSARGRVETVTILRIKRPWAIFLRTALMEGGLIMRNGGKRVGASTPTYLILIIHADHVTKLAIALLHRWVRTSALALSASTLLPLPSPLALLVVHYSINPPIMCNNLWCGLII